MRSSSTSEVKFYRQRTDYLDAVNDPDPVGGGKLLATLTATAVSQPEKNHKTEVETVARGDAQVLETIRPAGLREKLVFAQDGRLNSPVRSN
jgi:hypothetical protein